MSDINTVNMTGRLVEAPELQTSRSGTAWTKLRIANEQYEGKDAGSVAHWFTWTVWGKSAEMCCQYLVKGQGVTLEGFIKNDNYEKDGKKVWRDSFIARRVRFGAKPRGDSGSNGAPSQSQAPAPFDDEEIPF